MKQTAVEKIIQYFIEQKNNGASHWCINDLLGQLQQAKAMEKEQIENAFDNGWKRANETKDKCYTTAEDYGFNYYNETFKSE